MIGDLLFDISQLDEAYRQLVKLIGIHGYDC